MPRTVPDLAVSYFLSVGLGQIDTNPCTTSISDRNTS